MKAYGYIKEKQQLWAKLKGIELVGSKIDRGEKNYILGNTNFFQELSAETIDNYEAGDGKEFGDGINPGKIQALHSSSAITANVFDYWRNRDDKSDIAKALLIPSTKIKNLCFEKKYPIFDEINLSPNIDVVFNYENAGCCAIECKFTEPFTSREGSHGLKEKYLIDFKHWDEIGSLRKLAETISPGDSVYDYLHPAQLIKHILGLMTYYENNKSKFRLVYLYYSAFGEEDYFHKAEIDKFAVAAKQDEITFQSISWQELIMNIARISWDGHEKYIKYLVERYL